MAPGNLFDPQRQDEDPNLNESAMRLQLAGSRGRNQFVPLQRRAFKVLEVLSGTFDIGKLPVPVPAIFSGIIFLLLWMEINGLTHWDKMPNYSQAGQVVGWILLILGVVVIFRASRTLANPDPRSKVSASEMIAVLAVFIPSLVNPFGGNFGAWIAFVIVGTTLAVAAHFVYLRLSSGDLNAALSHALALSLLTVVVWVWAVVIAFGANFVATGQIMGPVNIVDYNNLQYQLDQQRPGYTPAAPARLLNGDPFKIAPTLILGAPAPTIAPTPSPAPTPDCKKKYGDRWYWNGKECVR